MITLGAAFHLLGSVLKDFRLGTGWSVSKDKVPSPPSLHGFSRIKRKADVRFRWPHMHRLSSVDDGVTNSYSSSEFRAMHWRCRLIDHRFTVTSSTSNNHHGSRLNHRIDPNW